MRRFLVLAVPLMLAACGTADAPPVATSAKPVAAIEAGAEHNKTDTMFLQMLIYHQEQGLAMSATAAKRARSGEVKELAGAVQATERDELTMMRSWLREWNEPADVDTDVNLHADHVGLPGTGSAEIKALTTVKAASFDSAFLNLFLAHQHNAVEMATLESDKGANRAAKAFATRVRDSRQAEIRQMLRLMNG